MYPSDPEKVMPTKLGNVLKASESYGRERYGLDTVILWEALVSVAPESMREQLASERAAMDRWLGTLLLAYAFAVSTAAFAGFFADIKLIVVAVVALALVYPMYLWLVEAAVAYGNSIRALVDVTRFDLADALQLVVPRSGEDEREMWGAVTGLSAWGVGWPATSRWESKVSMRRKPPS